MGNTFYKQEPIIILNVHLTNTGAVVTPKYVPIFAATEVRPGLIGTKMITTPIIDQAFIGICLKKDIVQRMNMINVKTDLLKCEGIWNTMLLFKHFKN